MFSLDHNRISHVLRSRILGTGRALPARVVTNDDLATRMDTSDDWIRERTGIEERRWVTGESCADLATAAARDALAAAGLQPSDIDAIVLATSTPDHFAPGVGVFVQRALEIPGIPALDIRTQCSGFVYALSVADAWIQVGLYRRILVIGAEVQSTGMDVSSRGRNTAVIFADGAGAVVLGVSDDPARGILGFDLHSDGTGAEKLWLDSPVRYHESMPIDRFDPAVNCLQMDGRDVFRNAVVRMPESVMAVLAKIGQPLEALDLLVPHQANLRISEMVQKTLKLRDAQVVNNIQRYGNTTAGTIPIALDEAVREGRVQAGDLVVLTAFGSGFLWGSCALRW